ncbi:MAG TPA: hypothetical protein VGK32_13025 [Vicinamibacterales bacterium]|jgi:hypothetical protein
MPRTEIRPVGTAAELKAFINLAWDLYAGDPLWVPPIKSEIAALLTPGRHPFWRFSRRELFLAWRGGRPIGRIAAIVDENHNRQHNERMGIWGFFECPNDLETAAALFRAAEQWLTAEGAAFARGPLNPSMNYEIGALIQGFDSPPALMMTYNPPFYADLAHLCGYRKEKDLVSYVVGRDVPMPPWAVDLAKRIADRGEFAIITADRRHFTSQLHLLNQIYNECWSKNWGFVPMTDEEIDESAKLAKHFADLDLAFGVRHGDTPVGVCLLLPDLNPLLRRFNGKLGIRALAQYFRYRSEVTGLRGLIFGVKEEYRQMGLPFFVLNHLLHVLEGKPQYRTIELGWDLEDNDAINFLYEEGGLRVQKRWRLFRKDLRA